MAKHVRDLMQVALIACSLCGLTATAEAQSPPASWTQAGMLTCRVNPSIGFVIFGHQSMECRFVQNPPFPLQAYEGALNTIGLDIGITAGGALPWAVLAPTVGTPAGALAGEYVGASGDIGLGLGAGVNVLVGGSGRSIALQPVSVEGSVAVNVTLGVSGLQLRPVY
jgi:ABC-type amino acid transport substrate-binding protein